MRIKNKNIKLIIVDIDNTILPIGKDRISNRTKKTFESAQKKGVSVLVDTGRHYTFLPPSLFEDMNLETIVTVNGACVNNRDGSIIYSKEMDKTSMDKIVELADAHEMGLGFKFADQIVTYANHEKFLAGYTHNDPKQNEKILIDDDKRAYHLTHGLPLGTFLITDETDMSEETKAIPELTFAWSSKRGFDVFQNDITKATGAQVVLDQMGIGWDRVMAFGDAENDIPMIEKAAIGYAMKNSKQVVKDAADGVAPDCNEDGVAQILESFGLTD